MTDYAVNIPSACFLELTSAKWVMDVFRGPRVDFPQPAKCINHDPELISRSQYPSSLGRNYILLNPNDCDSVWEVSRKAAKCPLVQRQDRALTVGLVRQCQTIHGRDRTCIPPRLPPEWVTTLFFIIMGIISLTVTCGLLVASHWRREATKYARWIAFTGMILFCMAALIFPIGFYINEVGGQPYKLPNNTVVGSSYVLFVLSIFFTIVGLLFAGKVCLPG
ncbi:uncharacterized protein C16orf52 homolog [Pteropus vampyrus]|uniref:Modulator of smoothened protein n=1 Tax=Pteropus vampyrus TaxID=132908 RepID=A0A6P6BWT0_PTEVA|nr:uncharacterized protein C16orf52 homolog [Pteropus vampyrus]